MPNSPNQSQLIRERLADLYLSWSTQTIATVIAEAQADGSISTKTLRPLTWPPFFLDAYEERPVAGAS